MRPIGSIVRDDQRGAPGEPVAPATICATSPYPSPFPSPSPSRRNHPTDKPAAREERVRTLTKPPQRLHVCSRLSEGEIVRRLSCAGQRVEDLSPRREPLPRAILTPQRPARARPPAFGRGPDPAHALIHKPDGQVIGFKVVVEPLARFLRPAQLVFKRAGGMEGAVAVAPVAEAVAVATA